MANKAVIAALKEINKGSIDNVLTFETVDHMFGESDRSFIILNGSIVEEFLSRRLKREMGHLNADEATRLFDFSGAIGSFSDKINIAYAMKIISKTTKDDVTLIREMRNVAAHCLRPLSFELTEVSNIVRAFYPQPDWKRLDILSAKGFRMLYGGLCSTISADVCGTRFESYKSKEEFLAKAEKDFRRRR